jgi:hypothetical protein|eukprot:COSAG01_NODE_122_length_25212_cov_25.945646_23_plen_85_part_00
MYHVVNKPRLYIIRLHPKDQAAADGCHCGHTLSQLGVRGPSRRDGSGVVARRRLCASMPPYLLRAVITEHASSQTRREISVKSG